MNANDDLQKKYLDYRNCLISKIETGLQLERETALLNYEVKIDDLELQLTNQIKTLRVLFGEVQSKSIRVGNQFEFGLSMLNTKEEKVEYLKKEIKAKFEFLTSLDGRVCDELQYCYNDIEIDIQYITSEYFISLDMNSLFSKYCFGYIDLKLFEEIIDESVFTSYENLVTHFPIFEELTNGLIVYITYVEAKEFLKQLEENNILNPSKTKSRFLSFEGGSKLNLKERYKLIDLITGLDKDLAKLKNPKKEQLLSFILECNPKNAQQIINDKYDGKFREQEIVNYVERIRKE
jgi:hypothetical protein